MLTRSASSPRLRKVFGALTGLGGLGVLGALSCTTDSSSPPPAACTVTTEGDATHRVVTDGTSELRVDVTASSVSVRLTVDGALALDVGTISTPQGWASTARQGPAYASQQQHVIHLSESNDEVTGDVDGRPLAPFANGADPKTVHFADGKPFDPGIAPSSAHIVDTYQHLLDGMASGGCVVSLSGEGAGGLKIESMPSQTESPQTEAPCTNCKLNCDASSLGLLHTGLAACSVLDGVAFGIPLLICAGAAAAAAEVVFVVCQNNCAAVGGACCPKSCNLEDNNDFCCDSNSVCADRATHRCCPSGTSACGASACCESGTEACVSPATSTCCPFAQVNGKECCAQGTKPTNGACCPNDSPTACNGVCCGLGQTQCTSQGECCAPSQMCGSACCSPFSTCVDAANSKCCETGQACGTNCCPNGTTCTGLVGQQECCPTARACGTTCCGPNQTCNGGVCSDCPSGETSCTAPVLGAPTMCCPTGATCTTTQCCPASQPYCGITGTCLDPSACVLP